MSEYFNLGRFVPIYEVLEQSACYYGTPYSQRPASN